MKKLTTLFFALTMILSIAFIGGAVSTGDKSFAASGQTVTVRAGGPELEGEPTAAVNTSFGELGMEQKYVSKKVWVATKWTGKKTYKTGRKVVSRTKKIIY